MTELAPSPQAKVDFLFEKRRVWIMGVLNVTPDSFYEDARSRTVEEAFSRAQRLIQEGADVLDLGGESTRPGAQPVSLSEELDRLLPLVERLHQRWPEVPLSIDTRKAEVARECLQAGAAMINDVSALRHDPEMGAVIASARCPVVLMHMQGNPQTMQENPHYEDLVGELKTFFEERCQEALRQGIPENRIILDPGLGFGKTLAHNVTILKHLSALTSLGRPVLVGISRKSFIGRLSRQFSEPPLPPPERLEGSLAANLWALDQGAQGLRVHDVEATRRTVAVWQAIRESSG